MRAILSLVLLATAAFASGALGQGVAITPPEPRQIIRGVWLIPEKVIPDRRPDGNTIVLQAPKGLIVADTGRHPYHRQAILDFARTRGQPIAAIVNSHWHLDHVSGNPDLKAAYPSAKVYASNAIDDALGDFLAKSLARGKARLASGEVTGVALEELKLGVATLENGAALRPDVVVSRSSSVNLAGRRVQLNLAPYAATSGDVWLYDPKTRIAVIGDLVTLPAPYMDTGCMAGWSRALAQVSTMPFVTVIPGHGAPMTRAEFETYRQGFDALIRCSASDRPASQCGVEWAQAAKGLLALNRMDEKDAAETAESYVAEVLRPNGGNAASCRDPS